MRHDASLPLPTAPYLRAFAVCPGCGELYPAARQCPACSGVPLAAQAAPVEPAPQRVQLAQPERAPYPPTPEARVVPGGGVRAAFTAVGIAAVLAAMVALVYLV